jgi:hypothetical protein
LEQAIEHTLLGCGVFARRSPESALCVLSHIGLVPEDQRVPITGWLPEHRGKRVLAEVYLVEGEPLDGASGAPVFTRRTLGPFGLAKAGKLQGQIEGSIWLLGLQTDAFTAKAGEDYDPRMRGMMPRGINVVAPIQKIVEVMDHPELIKQLKVAQEG